MDELHVELRLKDIDDDEAYIPRSEVRSIFDSRLHPSLYSHDSDRGCFPRFLDQ